MNADDLLSRLIGLNNMLFVQRRHACADPAAEAEAAALARQLDALDTDGSLTARLREACAAFVAQELKEHPPGSVDPYADIAPAPAEAAPITRDELQALTPEDAYYTLGELLAERSDLTGPAALVQLLFRFDNEVQNGGVSQFFLNGGAALSAQVLSALTAVGAKKYASLYATLLAECDPAQPDISACERFDEAYYRHYSRTPLGNAAGRYIRRNISDLPDMLFQP